MSLPDALRFTVSLTDKITAPLAAIQTQFNQLQETYTTNASNIAAGGVAIMGAGMAIHSALAPAIEMDRALAGLRGLDISADGLNTVKQTALEFSTTYGMIATDVVAYGEQMRTSMGNMPADVLAATTKASATLGIVMKSDAQTVGRLMKNLHGNFSKQANEMGLDGFANHVANLTTKVRSLFGTSMDEMEGMVDGMHSLSSTLGVSMEDQFAILGTLSKSMSQGDAVTQFTNYLEGAWEAQEKLGIKLTDDAGNLLPMVDVVEKLAPKLKGMSDIEARFKLDEAGLGDASLMLINLVKNADDLKQNMAELSNIDVNFAQDMAEKMKDQWGAVGQSVGAIQTAFGSAILPALVPVAGAFAELAMDVVHFTEQFPHLTKYLSGALLGILSIGIAGGVFMIVGALVSNFIATMKLLSPILIAVKNGLIWCRGAMLGLNMAMAANPIGFIVAGVVALGAGVIILMNYWNDLKASFSDTTWFQALTLITAPLRILFETIKAGWDWAMSGFTDLSAFDGIFSIIEEVQAVFTNMFSSVSSGFDTVAGWFGFGGDDESKNINAVQQARPTANVQSGGIISQMSTMNSSRTTHYGGVNIYPAQMNSPMDFGAQLEMAAP